MGYIVQDLGTFFGTIVREGIRCWESDEVVKESNVINTIEETSKTQSDTTVLRPKLFLEIDENLEEFNNSFFKRSHKAEITKATIIGCKKSRYKDPLIKLRLLRDDFTGEYEEIHEPSNVPPVLLKIQADPKIIESLVISEKERDTFVVPFERFELLGDSENFITTYTFGTNSAKHTFCKVCGITSFYTPRSNKGIAITYRCVDPGTLSHIEIKHFDGMNWEKSQNETDVPKGSGSGVCTFAPLITLSGNGNPFFLPPGSQTPSAGLLQ
ncbi:Mss4-like protein [Cynara cardunculus var. scolymus]|uniref:Mss4-like protein n=1 Tax=Cynara cardunculus var. scolymus TaxID=59895 RepID=A0A103Y5V5_CYNCS|nr:Mss4-like protein [Cynara cardunculus var. scolymus]